MRISLARCALVVFSAVILAGCQGGSTWSTPSWSLSKLNPFPSFSGLAAKTPRPERPSNLTSPTLPAGVAPEYTAATPDIAEPSSQYSDASTSYNTLPGGYSSTQWQRYPSSQSSSPASYRTAASGAASGLSAVGPQRGPYDPNAGYGASDRSSYSGLGSSTGSSLYSSNANPNVSVSPGVSGYRSADQEYNTAGATGPYGYAGGTVPQYGVASGRYGSNPAASDPYGDLQSSPQATTNPYASLHAQSRSPYTTTPQNVDTPYSDSQSPYGALGGSRSDGGSISNDSLPAGAGYSRTPDANPYRNPNAYGGYGSGSLVGDRYAQPDAGSTDGGTRDESNSYGGGQFSDSQGGYDWNPGDTGYTPGGSTPNMPGGTGYDPGNTGYSPPGVSPYSSPANSYTPPSSSTDATTPFLPGSTKRSLPRNTILSDAPGLERSSGSTGTAETDSQVIPAGHYPMPTGSAL
jgi:hypothetical protein